MAVIFTKDGNAIRVSTNDNKVIWLSVEDFMSAFTYNKINDTVDVVAGKLVVRNIPVAELGIANPAQSIPPIFVVSNPATLGAFIQLLCELDTDAGAGFSGSYNDLTDKPDLDQYATDGDLSSGLSGKENAIGFTPEDVDNKQTDLSASATKYPTVNAVNTGLSGKQNSLGYTAENVSNKDTNTSLGTSDTAYPSQKAAKNYIDAAIAAAIAALGISEGTYTPTLAANGNANVASSAAFTTYYIKIGKWVNVYGFFNITPTALGVRTIISMSLPVASTMASSTQIGGTATAQITATGVTQAVRISAINSSGNAAMFEYTSVDIALGQIVFSFSYKINP